MVQFESQFPQVLQFAVPHQGVDCLQCLQAVQFLAQGMMHALARVVHNGGQARGGQALRLAQQRMDQALGGTDQLASYNFV